MYAYLVRRLFTVVLLMWLMTVITFALSSISGGGLDRLFPTSGITPFDVSHQKAMAGTDRSPAQQYFTWLGQVLGGNLGVTRHESGSANQDLGRLLVPMFKASLSLILTALVFCVAVGLALGTFAALKPNHPVTRLINLVNMVNVSVPEFAVGILLMIIFAVTLRWLPSSGYSDPLLFDPSPWRSFVDRAKHIILPGFTLSVTYVAAFTEHIRKTLTEVMRQDYIRTARSKGLPEWKVVLKHGMRNGIVPVIAAVFSSLPFFLGGLVIVEYLFAWPGIGMFIFRNFSGFRADFYAVLMVTGVVSFFSLMASLIADVLYAMADPRISNPMGSPQARPNLRPLVVLVGGGVLMVILYHWRLFASYSRLGGPVWGQVGLAFALVAVAIPLQFRHSRRRPVPLGIVTGRSSGGGTFRLSVPKERLTEFMARLVKPSIIMGLVVLWLLVLASYYPVLRGFQVPTDIPLDIAMMSKGPSLAHLFGTDSYGRDEMMVVLLVSRQTLKVSFVVALLGTLAGSALGVLCGFLQGFFDKTVMAVIDLVSSIPSYFLVFLAIGIVGKTTGNLIIVLSIFGIVEIARVVRAQVLTVRGFQFIEAAQSLGNSRVQIIVRHLLRNLLSLMWGQGLIFVGRTMLLLCSLGYLNILDFPTWGSLAAASIRSSEYLSNWWTCAFPIMMIFVTVLAIHAVGKGVLKSFDPFANR